MRRGIVLAFVAAVGAVISGDAIAAPWCGTVSDVDRPAAVAGYPVRVVYAVAVDGADRAAEVAPGIAADIAEIDAWWRREDSSRTPRIDVTAFPCGLQPDIVRLRVPRSAGELSDPRLAFVAIWDALLTWPIPGWTKYIVYYDGPTSTNLCGTGAGNSNGFGVAVVFARACADYGQASTAVHELLHAMGAVPRVGPTSNCAGDAAHVCDSTGDIMYPYAQFAPLNSFQLDVGRNDYYGHSGSWLDTQESFWLHRLDTSIPIDTELRGAGSVRSDVPGLDCSSSCRTAWSPRTRVTLTATPAAGGKFVGWEEGCGGSGACVLDLDSAKKVIAVFAPERYGVSVSVAGRGRVTSAPGGLACPGRCSAQFPSHEYIVLTAKADKGWRLSAWSGACRGRKSTCELPLTAAASARATFVRAR
jgi:hypothetical protein